MLSRSLRQIAPWLLGWAGVSLLGAALLARQELQRQREAFENDARIAHRLLSQRASQHDAVLGTLALLQPAPGAEAVQRLPAVYPQILGVRQRAGADTWDAPELAAAEARSRVVRAPALAQADFAQGRGWLVLAAEPASFALQVDLRAAVPWAEWPMARATSPVRLVLAHAGQQLVLQPGREAGAGWRFDVAKPLASTSQPFELRGERVVTWAELPWAWMAVWTTGIAALTAALAAWQRQRAARRRAEELLRLGQVARLNTLGELAAGLAHELNQPLTAVLANTQAASRLLADDPPDIDNARQGMAQAAEQARRASDVVARLRRTIERPGGADAAAPVVLQQAVRNAFDLLEPEFARRGVAARLEGAPGITVHAEPVALEQIVHNLLMNALQALDQVPAGERELAVRTATDAGRGVLTVADTGPGIAPELLPRIFEPFVSTRERGLGLGLSLCESLAQGMGGSLQAETRPRGALFRLSLPLATA